VSRAAWLTTLPQGFEATQAYQPASAAEAGSMVRVGVVEPEMWGSSVRTMPLRRQW